MPAVFAGDLRHYVTIESPTVVQNVETGEEIRDWLLVAYAWAAINPQSGNEYIAASAAQSEVRNRLTIRYRDDVDASCRVVYRGKWYAIHAVLPDAESGTEHLTLMCGEGVRLDQ